MNNIKPFYQIKEGEKWYDTEGQQRCSTLLNSAELSPRYVRASPFLCDFTYLCIAYRMHRPPASYFHLSDKWQAAYWCSEIFSAWPGFPHNVIILCAICIAPFPSMEKSHSPGVNNEAAGRSTNKHHLTCSGRNKIKWHSSLEQERLFKWVLPGNVRVCVLRSLTRACHRIQEADAPVPGGRTELQWGPNPFILMSQWKYCRLCKTHTHTESDCIPFEKYTAGFLFLGVANLFT